MSQQENTIILTDEEGKEHEFLVVDILSVDEYAVLLPVGEESEPDEAIVLKIDVDEEGNEVLREIEDEEEWERVVQAWEERLENLEE